MKKSHNATRAIAGAVLVALLSACAGQVQTEAAETDATVEQEGKLAETLEDQPQAVETVQATEQETVVTTASTSGTGILKADDLLTDRDLTQTADLTDATYLTLADGQDVTISEEGVYVVSGTATNATIRVEADDSAKVQIVLDGVTITNDDAPAIYVVSADKVFVTTAQGSGNSLSVTGTFVADGDTSTDAAIFAKDDLVLNGLGTLTINSTDNGVSCKDDLKVTGGTLVIDCQSDALEANDSVVVAGGDITITTVKDGIHAEYDEDDTVGYVYVCGGTLSIDAGDDAIHATTYLQVDGGTIAISAAEALEGTYVQINGGDLDIQATDDGINASYKSNSLGTPTIEINDGSVTIEMAQGDTDALDSNGYLYINGGTVDITAQFAFDYEIGAELNGGTVTVNGEQVTQITESMMMGGMGGPMGGQMGEMPSDMGEAPSGEMPSDMGGGMQGGPAGGPGGMGGGPGF